ncbi:hypothetical protein [Streptomyces sp. NRRL B-24484]|uniref:hypothetical protein n=1 Tax=Streptomyces sp. NRRL B-24484 TaxID=1463833 RepID=UPI0004BE98C3|nr:hypothetical protein [Streptomyces sp. NRRL B-24484]
MTTTPPIPPPPSEPPTVGMPTREPAGEIVTEWWRREIPAQPVPGVHIPVPVEAGHVLPSVEAAAAAFWAPAGKLFAEQATAIASQVGEQVGQFLTETEPQRFARQQVEYEALVDAQRAERDAAFAAAGETAAQRAERHRVEKILTPDRPLHRDDLVGLVDMLGARITETPEDRAARLETERETAKRRARAEEDARLAAAGETPEQRTKRHRQQQLADQREAKTRARRQRRRAARAAGPSERTWRFRRWCVLTAISATAGYMTGLVQLITPGGPYVGLLLAAFGWALDLHMRDRGRLRVSEVTGPFPLALLVLARIPVASGLAVALGLGNVLAALPLY